MKNRQLYADGFEMLRLNGLREDFQVFSLVKLL